jgi:hypothetical protein
MKYLEQKIGLQKGASGLILFGTLLLFPVLPNAHAEEPVTTTDTSQNKSIYAYLWSVATGDTGKSPLGDCSPADVACFHRGIKDPEKRKKVEKAVGEWAEHARRPSLDKNAVSMDIREYAGKYFPKQGQPNPLDKIKAGSSLTEEENRQGEIMVSHYIEEKAAIEENSELVRYVRWLEDGRKREGEFRASSESTH